MNDGVGWLQFAFDIGSWSINIGQILGILFSLGFVFLLYRLVIQRILPWYYSVDKEMPPKEKASVKRKLLSTLVLILLISFLIILRFDYVLFSRGEFILRITTLLEGLLILQFARILDRTLSRVLSNRYRSNEDELHEESNQHRLKTCLLYTSPSPRDATLSRMPSSA